MAKKGTFTTLQPRKPIAEDFGGIGEKIAEDFVRDQAREEELKIKGLLAKTKAKAQANKLAQQSFKDLDAMNKLAKDFLTLKPLAGTTDVTSLMVSQGKQEYANYQRKLLDPNVSQLEKAQIKSTINNMSEWGRQWNTMTNDFNTMLADITKKMGEDGGYDDILSAKTVISLMNAVKDGKLKGGLSKGKGKIGYGDYITVEDVGNGALQVTLSDDQGNEIVSGGIGEIVETVRNSLKPFVNSDKTLYHDFGKGMTADIIQTAINDGSLINLSRKTVDQTTIERLNYLFDSQFGSKVDGKYDNQFIRKELAKGTDGDPSSYEEIKQRAVGSAYSRMRREAIENIKASPEFKARAKEENINQRTRDIQSAMMANPDAARIIRGGTWDDVSPSGRRNGALKSIKRDGDVFTVELSFDKGKSIESISYDLNDPKIMSAVSYKLNDIYSKKTGDATVLFTDLNKRFTIEDVAIKPTKEGGKKGEFAETAEEAVASFEEKFNKLSEKGVAKKSQIQDVIREIEPLLTSKGLSVSLSPRRIFLGSDELTITDKDGNEVEKISVSGDRKEFTKQAAEALKRQALGDNTANNTTTTKSTTPLSKGSLNDL